MTRSYCTFLDNSLPMAQQFHVASSFIDSVREISSFLISFLLTEFFFALSLFYFVINQISIRFVNCSLNLPPGLMNLPSNNIFCFFFPSELLIRFSNADFVWYYQTVTSYNMVADGGPSTGNLHNLPHRRLTSTLTDLI